MKVDLYLNDNLVEINQDIDFVLNKQYTELTDLTSIIVDYTKTIKVPMTARNNELFNYMFKLERQVIISNDVISYDPTQRIPMKMMFNSSLALDGYAVLNAVNVKDKTYEINIFGQLGKIFKDMKEKSLTDYNMVSNGFWKSIRMNTYNIKKSFLNQNHSGTWSSTDWSDFYGFAPQFVGKTDNIDTTAYEVYGTNESKKFADVINTTRNITYGETYIGDGLDINQYQEIRSYMTRPYVYVDKLIELVKNEINTSDYDGYQLTLDNDWFNTDNPYYYNLCYFPGTESLVDNGGSVNGTVTWNNSERNMYFPQTYMPNTSEIIDLDGYTYTVNNNLATIENSDSSSETNVSLVLNADGIVVRDRVNGVSGDMTRWIVYGKWAYYNIPGTTRIPLRYIGVYDSDDQLIYKLYLCNNEMVSVHEESEPFYSSHIAYPIGSIWKKLKALGPKVVVPNSCTWTNNGVANSYCELIQVYNFGNLTLNTNSFRFKLGCDLIYISWNNCTVVEENISYSDYHTLCPFKDDNYKNYMWNDGATYELHFRPIQMLTVTSNNYRSGSRWSILDILGKDFNPFTWLIDYAKKFRLFFDIDYKTKIINLKADYFNNISYKEMIVDYNKDVIIEPIVDKYNIVKYGYGENKCKRGVNYYKSKGVQYGDMDINTNITITTDKLSLLPNAEENVFIPVLSDALVWNNLNSTAQIKTYNVLNTNKVINTLNKNGEIEYFPFYAFRGFNVLQNSNFYWISDDSTTQRNTGKYNYLERSSDWMNSIETTEDGNNVYYLVGMNSIPQFDNYIEKSVLLNNDPVIHRIPAYTALGSNSGSTGIDFSNTELVINPNVTPSGLDTIIESNYINPFTGRTEYITRTDNNYITSLTDTQRFLVWSTFAVPSEVYNGYIPSNISHYSIYNRWENYLNEIFNPNNKKVTCYVRMNYPEFLDFKFNQLFVIDNCVFLVNKIIDFNPNSAEPTKVELIQISDVNNLK